MASLRQAAPSLLYRLPVDVQSLVNATVVGDKEFTGVGRVPDNNARLPKPIELRKQS